MLAIQCCGTEDYVIVNMRFICMSSDYKSMVSLEKPTGELKSDPVCFLWGDFSGLERLPELIRNHFSVPVTASYGTGVTMLWIS